MQREVRETALLGVLPGERRKHVWVGASSQRKADQSWAATDHGSIPAAISRLSVGCRLSDVRDGGLKEGILRVTVADLVLKQVDDDSQSQGVHHWSLCALQARWGLWCGSNVVG